MYDERLKLVKTTPEQARMIIEKYKKVIDFLETGIEDDIMIEIPCPHCAQEYPCETCAYSVIPGLPRYGCVHLKFNGYCAAQNVISSWIGLAWHCMKVKNPEKPETRQPILDWARGHIEWAEEVLSARIPNAG